MPLPSGNYNYTHKCYKLLDYVPIGICIFDETLKLIFWNKCLSHWTGIRPHQIIGEKLNELFSPLNTPSFKARIEPIFKGGPPSIFSSHLHRAMIPCKLSDGTEMIQQTMISSIPGQNAGTFHALMSIKNVTELTQKVAEYRILKNQAVEEVKLRKKIEADLRESGKKILDHQQKIIDQEKLKVLLEMAGATAHEMNQPLMTLLGTIELINMTDDIPDNISSYLRQVEKSGQKIAEIVNKIQKIRQYQTKKYLNDMSIIDFNESSV